MNISNHAMERYVERTMGKEGNDMKQYLVQNNELVQERVLRLYESSEILYSGKLREYDKSHIYINKHGWVLIVNNNKDNIITLYKIDLGLDDDFNQIYVNKYKDKILSLINDRLSQTEFISSESKKYELDIDKNEKEIALLKTKITQLEKENKHFSDGIQIERDKLNVIDREIKNEIEKFVCKKLF